ncbi:IS630 family transposase [Bryobacter aggregatus]|uniref:IS630 family transposase n=2 Tax=Bryobacter aggregatus TaxID=360054 RepID=UPI00069200B5|nr:IS630 family transposase [Bryobacter aggregatus]
MGNPRGVARDFDALEVRRMRALALMREGFNNSQIGHELMVANQTVSRWRKEYSEGGRKALEQAGRAGRKPLLADKQAKLLTNKLLAGPEKLGYETPLWTCQRVADLIEQEFQIRYHPGHVWRILRALGWSPQRPVGRALERDEKAIREWKQVTWPNAKKKPRKKAAPLSSLTKAD